MDVDYRWLDDLPVAQFQDSYDAQGVYIGTETTYLHSDHLGTPRIGTNASKQITWRYRSDAFGIPGAETSMQVRLRFPGQIALGIAGINYNYFRDYEPQNGRYRESDPIGLDGGLNTYGYADQNPLTQVDPTGESAIALPLPSSPVVPSVAGVCTAGPIGVIACGGVGGYAVGSLLYPILEPTISRLVDACTENEEDKNCEALYQSTLATCASLTGRKRFACLRIPVDAGP